MTITRVTATKAVRFEISTYVQEKDDPDDGMRAGAYAFVGPPGRESDFMVGPFETRALAVDAAKLRLERMGYTVRQVKAHKPPPRRGAS